MNKKESINVVAAEIEENGRFLITQRRPHAMFPLYWEFPSGKVEPGESNEEALKREIFERLGVTVSVGSCTMFVKHEYDDYILNFHVYQCDIPHDVQLQAIKVQDWKWVHPQEMESYPFPPADAQTIRKLIRQENR